MTTSPTLASKAILEREARREWSETFPSMRREIVAIGVAEDDVWWELPNRAVSSGKAFLISGEDVKTAIQAIQGSYLLAGIAAVPALTIWHCHFVYNAPSRADLDNFPQWAKRGLLFHTPTGTTIAYGKSGVISPLAESEPVPYTSLTE